MSTVRKVPGIWVKASLWLVAGLLLTSCLPSRAETGTPDKKDRPNVRELPSHFPDKPSIPPSWTIPVEPLGFAAPGQNFLGMRNSLASLDFLGEDRLLFTFRVPGLMRREPGNSAEDQRQIRAVVIALPSGEIQSQTNWTVHDRSRYLWTLDDNHFLLRDRNTVYEGDASLNRKPLLQFPGPLISMQLNPGRQFIVTNSHEPTQSASTTGSPAPDDSSPGGASNIVLRILSRETKQVMLVTYIHNPIELPLNSVGFLNSERANDTEWNIVLNYLTGQNRTIGKVKSTCAPDLDFVSESQALVTACSSSGDYALVALSTEGTTLWTDLVSDKLVWPLIANSRGGMRFARETLYVSHSISAFDPLGTGDIKAQWVRVFDAATGDLAFESSASPILDAGGNVAISPSGRRVAILNAGTIQVFELPPPPTVLGPAASDQPASNPSH